jgi:1-acyl-sn-glycerol-3-phosphate acyltransferase
LHPIFQSLIIKELYKTKNTRAQFKNPRPERIKNHIMIRFILVCIVVIGYLILSIPILLIEWIIGKFSPETKDISSLRIIQAVFRFILWITGAKVTVIGEGNVPKDTPVLYIGNHRSYFDILLTYSRCPIRTGYIAKKEMEKIPLLSTWMRYLHCLFLDRKDIKQGLKTILTAVEKVKSGISICIFPEGTRNRNADETDMLPFHEGSFKIATKAKCPIIPIAINNSADIFEAHFPKMSPAKVVVEYGKPIYPDELSKEDKKHIGEYTQNIIREMLIKNKPLTEN